MLTDQWNWIKDRNHKRIIDESNAVESLRMAEQATKIAKNILSLNEESLMTAYSSTIERRDETKRSRFQKKKMLPYLLVSPYLLFVIVFVVFPVLFCFFLTFNKWNIIAPMHFIGFNNYSRLFHDRLFWKAIVNTLQFLLLHIPLQLVVSLFLAYLLNQKIKAACFFPCIFFYACYCFRRGCYYSLAAIARL